MKVTIIRPPFYALWGQSITHPLNIGYIVASLEQEGHVVAMVDGELLRLPNKSGKNLATSFKQLFAPPRLSEKSSHFMEQIMTNSSHHLWASLTQQVVATEPEAIGISCYSTTMTATRILVDRLKKQLPGVPIFCGGIHPTAMPLQTLRELPEVDYLVVGEGELTVKELIDCIGSGGRNINSIQGVGYRDSGRLILNPPRPLVDDLDSLPFPKRVFGDGAYYAAHVIITSRGCPYDCNFCASKVMWSRKVRYRAVENVVDELRQLKNLGLHSVRIGDDTFTLSKKRVMDWCDEVEKNNLNGLSYSIGSRADTIDQEMAMRLRSVNVTSVSLGIESGSPRIQRVIKKNLDLRKAAETVFMLNKHGIYTDCYFMIGHPSETKEDVNLTINLIKKLNHSPRNRIELNIVCPYPGTELWSLAKDWASSLSIDEWYSIFHQSKPAVNLTAMSDDELIDSIDKSYKAITFHDIKARIRLASHISVTNPKDFIGKMKSRLK